MSEDDQPSDSPNGGYDASSIQSLEGLDGVRKRPAMYIGSTGADGLHHLVQEVVDNSIDEALAGYCDSIEITIHADGSVSVDDNGRGIPVNKTDEGIPGVQSAVTDIHSGGKFDNDAYKVSGGLHGVGISAVNALSAAFDVTVRRNGAVWHQLYDRGQPNPDGEMEQLRQLNDEETTGTTIRFWPDEHIFETLEFNYSRLLTRLRELAFLNPGVEITLRDLRGDETESDSFRYDGGIREYVQYLNEGREPLHDEVIHFEGEDESPAGPVEVGIALQVTNDVSSSIHAFANNINTKDGGKHITGFKTALTRIINDYAKQHDMLSDLDTNLKGDDIREGMTAVISVKHPDPQFEGQTKTKLGNSEVRGITEGIMHDGLGTYLDEHPDVAETIISRAVQAAKARKAAEKAQEVARRDTPLNNTSLPGKLADCQEKDPSKAELFIVEGDSAGGCFTGDTEVALASGRSITFEELVEEQENGETHYCYTVDNDGRIQIQEITNPRRTQQDAELVRVTLDNGETIECTPDHEFMLRSGEYKEARDLDVGDALMPLYRKTSDADEDGITIDGYEMVKQPIMNSFWEFTHLLADRYNVQNDLYEDLDGDHKHHVDFDKRNNRPDNIERLDKDEHLELHREHVEKTLHDDEVQEELRKLKKSDAFREMMSERMQEDETVEVLREQAIEQWEDDDYKQYMMDAWWEFYNNNPEYRQRVKQRLAQAAREYWSKEEHREDQSERIEEYYENNPEAVEQRREEANEQWDDDELREWRSEKTEEQWDEDFREQRMEAYNQTYYENTMPFMKEVLEEDGDLDNYDERRREENDPNVLTKSTTIEKFFDDEEELLEALRSYNHRVAQVEELDKKADVYDIEVPETHNFALDSGVFVHNSAKQARNPQNQAVLPIRGKILNVERHRLDRILENEQVRNIITAFGTGVGDEFDIEEARYQNVILLVDADVDGAHIRTLLLTLFYRHMPEMLEHGYVYSAKPPLYRIRNNGKTYDVMTEEERERVVAEECNGNPDQVQRFKGLGEMNPEQLWDTTMDPENRTLKRITIDDAAKADRMFSVLMGSDVGPRKDFIKEHAEDADWVDI